MIRASDANGPTVMSLRSRVNAPREVATYRTYSEQVASQTTAATITRAVPAPAGAIPKDAPINKHTI